MVLSVVSYAVSQKKRHHFCFCNNLVECQSISVIFLAQWHLNKFQTIWVMYWPPRLICVHTLPWRKWIVKFPCVQQLMLVLFRSQFDIFCRNTPEELLKIHVVVWHHIYFWVPLPYNKPRNWCNQGSRSHTHTVNMKFRKLKKNNVRNTNKTRQLKQEVLELSSMGIHAGVQHQDQ